MEAGKGNWTEGIKQEAGGKKGQWRKYRERQLKLRAVGGVI